nr:MAG TPA: hypothetical protein [Caudoviricetes sp.]
MSVGGLSAHAPGCCGYSCPLHGVKPRTCTSWDAPNLL